MQMTCRPAAALGVCPFFQGSFATDQLMVGSQLSCGAGSLGCSPYPGGSCWACADEESIADKSTMTAPSPVAHCIGKLRFERSERIRRRDVPAMNSVSGTNAMGARCRPGRSPPGAGPRFAASSGSRAGRAEMKAAATLDVSADTRRARRTGRRVCRRNGRCSHPGVRAIGAALRTHGCAYRLDECRGTPRRGGDQPPLSKAFAEGIGWKPLAPDAGPDGAALGVA